VARDTLEPAPTALGDYDLLEKIGEGGVGTVYKARDRKSGQIVAIKVLSPEMARNPLTLKRFEQEFWSARALDHPNIVRALRYGATDDAHYLVMEFVPGEPLGAKMQRVGPLPEAEAIDIITQACSGLHYAHGRGLIHRDIKPDNLLVTPSGEVKVADLGLSKQLHTEANLTHTGRGLGTPHFMAPEQFRDAKNADVRCDVYSLGATLYQLVTGKLPFPGNNPVETFLRKMKRELTPPRKLAPELSERTESVILWALSSEPSQRPASCQQLLDVLTGTAPVPRAPGEVFHEPPPAKPSSQGTLVLVLVLVTLAAAFLGQWLFR
jgi:serine/threonine protein kinase